MITQQFKTINYNPTTNKYPSIYYNCKNQYPNSLKIINYSLKELNDITTIFNSGIELEYEFDDELESDSNVDPTAWSLWFFGLNNNNEYFLFHTTDSYEYSWAIGNVMAAMFKLNTKFPFEILNNKIKIIIPPNTSSSNLNTVKSKFPIHKKMAILLMNQSKMENASTQRTGSLPCFELNKYPYLPFKPKDPKKCIDPMIFKTAPITYIEI